MGQGRLLDEWSRDIHRMPVIRRLSVQRAQFHLHHYMKATRVIACIKYFPSPRSDFLHCLSLAAIPN